MATFARAWWSRSTPSACSRMRTSITAEAQRSRPATQDDKMRNAFLRRLVEERGLRAQLERQPADRATLRRPRLFPEGAQGEDRPRQGRARASRWCRARFVVLEAKLGEHPRQDRQDAARCDRQRSQARTSPASTRRWRAATKLMSDADAQLVPQLKTALEDAPSHARRRRARHEQRRRDRCSAPMRPRNRTCATRCRISPGQRAPARARRSAGAATELGDPRQARLRSRGAAMHNQAALAVVAALVIAVAAALRLLRASTR